MDSDGCPNDPDKTEPGVCGCGVAEDTGDDDNDGTVNCLDGCPNDPDKIEPGVCGCGVAEDTGDDDNDGTINCLDGCPIDPDKTEPGVCGCGVAEDTGDDDNDGTVNCLDNCPNDPEKTAEGLCGCGVPDTQFDTNLATLHEKIGALDWVAYSPRNYTSAEAVSREQLERDLALLGSRHDGLIYYTSVGEFSKIPDIASDNGFQGVVAGIWDLSNDDEFTHVHEYADLIDGIFVGNERLNRDDGYPLSELEEAVRKGRLMTCKPVSTGEERPKYFDDDGDELINVCDWLMPHIHPFNDGIPTPEEAVKEALQHYDALSAVTDKRILVAETGWPTNGGERTSELAQARFYTLLEQEPVIFSYFEAFDQPWKVHAPTEPYWGIRHPDGSPKLFLEPERYINFVICVTAASETLACLDTAGALVCRRALADGFRDFIWAPDKDKGVAVYDTQLVFFDRSCSPTRSVDLNEHSVGNTAWSPDGAYFLFADPFEGILAVNTDTGSLTMIVTTYGYTLDHCPTVSPDGSMLVYIHHTYGTHAAFRACEFRGAEEVQNCRNIYDTRTGHNTCLPRAWLDERALAFVNTNRSADDVGLNVIDVVTSEVTSLDSRVATLLADPSGEKLYYYIAVPEESAGDIYEISGGGLAFRDRVLFHAPSQPSPKEVDEGTFLFFTSATGSTGIYLWQFGESYATHLITANEVADLLERTLDAYDLSDLCLLPMGQN